MNEKFSVSMCVYGGDQPEWFDRALRSIAEQTFLPAELVLVADGPISAEIESVIEKYQKIFEEDGKVCFTIVRLEHNAGQGIARRISIENCRHEYIAIMDADDISLPNRFERELEYIVQTGVDVVGGDIAEFIGNEEKIIGKRCVPVDNESIREYMKRRCPFNQVTVMFRRTSYQMAGGYVDWFGEEDYYLWLRMATCGAVFANTGEVVAHVRVNDETYCRRGGKQYFFSEVKLQGYMLRHRVISVPRYIINITERFVLQILMPNKVRGWVYKKLARE